MAAALAQAGSRHDLHQQMHRGWAISCIGERTVVKGQRQVANQRDVVEADDRDVVVVHPVTDRSQHDFFTLIIGPHTPSTCGASPK